MLQVAAVQERLSGPSSKLELVPPGQQVDIILSQLLRWQWLYTRGEGRGPEPLQPVPRFSNKRLSEPGAWGNETKRNHQSPQRTCPPCILTASPSRTGWRHSGSIVQCAGVLRQRAGSCGMMRLVSETRARVPSPELQFREPSLSWCAAAEGPCRAPPLLREEPPPPLQALGLCRCLPTLPRFYGRVFRYVASLCAAKQSNLLLLKTSTKVHGSTFPLSQPTRTARRSHAPNLHSPKLQRLLAI